MGSNSPPPPLTGKDPSKPRRPLKDYTYYVPVFMDHAYATTGALKAPGCKTVLLLPTDEYSWELGLNIITSRIWKESGATNSLVLQI